MFKNIILVGCGHMGYAMLRPWVDSRVASNIWVVTPHIESLQNIKISPFDQNGVHHVGTPLQLPADLRPDFVLFAVKPQIIGAVLPDYRRFSDALFLSVAAGKSLLFYQEILGAGARIIRAMPNMPAKYGKGITLLSQNHLCAAQDAAHAKDLLSVLGEVVFLSDETMMDAATALSGCGPAYFYYLADALADTGEKLGLSADIAKLLARQTLIGSAALWEFDNQTAQYLYESIAVKGGMTEAALAVYSHDNALKNLTDKALEEAVKRAKILAVPNSILPIEK